MCIFANILKDKINKRPAEGVVTGHNGEIRALFTLTSRSVKPEKGAMQELHFLSHQGPL